jgi:hypothetical protein
MTGCGSRSTPASPTTSAAVSAPKAAAALSFTTGGKLET